MASKFVAFTSLGRRSLPNQWDLIALSLIFGLFVLVARGSHDMTVPLPAPDAAPITLDYAYLPYYALRTTLRMFLALAASLAFTLTYATLAAKSRRAEAVLIPLLDVLQSVPILGFLSFTVTFFLGLFPGSSLGAELACIFAIFTSQAWNMAFSFYQSLRTVPGDLAEVSEGFRLSPWQTFWQLETPFAMPGLIYNTMMSMSGGWFFVVAAEAITVGDTTIKLPGIGSYLATAIDQKDIGAVLVAVAMVLVVILLYDQLVFRPIVAFSDKFKVELSASQTVSKSWVLDLLARTFWVRRAAEPLARAFDWFTSLRLDLPAFGRRRAEPSRAVSRAVDVAWFAVIALIAVYAGWQAVLFIATTLDWHDVLTTIGLTLITMVRVVVLLVLASFVWVPIAVWIGLRPRIAQRVQPAAQFLAAFPANVVFPIAVVGILTFHLDPDIWLSFLIIFGTQWYIVFNVIAGASAFPNDLREAAANFRISGLTWWFRVMIPGIFPYYVTGALTASGGSWNAAIVAEYVKWGNDKVSASGIGAYIAQATEAGDFPRIVLGVAMMSIFVILYNRLLWRPLFSYAERRLRLS
ncbi:ABC transporter permease subunit [Lichenibacterium minor]|uniref:ABC transporter permease subunit n=1 Tax=Lichenibacterium minor TaxID=2316528 RepID=A0A4V1RUK3_9HYPH|nr:ABC transporter permease subunit [Lichenibacterium minor]RYC31454.1 ABC transporter permease subunit [Lichenibacterium minor]